MRRRHYKHLFKALKRRFTKAVLVAACFSTLSAFAKESEVNLPIMPRYEQLKVNKKVDKEFDLLKENYSNQLIVFIRKYNWIYVYSLFDHERYEKLTDKQKKLYEKRRKEYPKKLKEAINALQAMEDDSKLIIEFVKELGCDSHVFYPLHDKLKELHSKLDKLAKKCSLNEEQIK